MWWEVVHVISSREWAKCTLNDLEKEKGGLLMFC